MSNTDTDRAINELTALIRQRRVTTDDVRYLGQWVRMAGAHACDDIRNELRKAGYDWMVDAVGASLS